MRTTFSRKITLRFTVIIGLLISLNLLFYELQARHAATGGLEGRIMETSGRERALVTRTALLAGSLHEARGTAAEEARREELLQAMRLLDQSHQSLLREELTEPVRAVYYDEPVVLNQKLDSYLAAVRAMTEGYPDARKLEKVTQAALSAEFVKGLDLAVQEHRAAHDEALARAIRLREWSLRANLFLLSLVGLFVFLPMVRQVQKDMADLAKLNIILEERVSSEKQTQAEISKHASELARSNTELEQFASVASHDLQEPLRKILAFGDRLQRKCGDTLDPESLDYLKRMRGAAGRMQDLINGLLNYSRVSSRAQPFERVPLSRVVSEVLTDLEARIEQAAARVEVQPLPEIDADPMQMRQLMQNLIGNALKFHRQDRLPVIRVEGVILSPQQAQERGYSRHEKLCEIAVEDNGVGFDPKHADRMFNVFQRLHSRKEFEGTGVGLAICRKIAERHGGRISAKSQLGQGARFTITLPLRQVNHEQAA